jgi:maleate isomerase
MTASTRRFGVLVPPANVAVEDEFRRFVPEGVQYHVARLFRRTFEVNYDTLSEMVTSTEQAAARVAQVKPEVIVWACTSGSFIEGEGHDVEIARRIESAAGGVPAITTSTAMVGALRAVGARRVYLVTPYIQDINEREERFLRDSGFAVTHTASFLHTQTLAIRETASEDVAALVLAERARAEEFDTVFISCTQLHSMDQIATLERKLAVPVVTSNQATLWAALRHMGVPTHDLGAGRLFELPGAVSART